MGHSSLQILLFVGLAVCVSDHVEAKGWEDCDALQDQADILKQINAPGYDKQRQPLAPVVVNMTYIIHDIVEVNELARYLKLKLTFFQKWFDHRLAVTNSSCDQNLDVPLPESSYDSIWTPTIRITNSIAANTISTPYKVHVITATPTGRMKFRVNIITQQSCEADYKRFPFDTVRCDFVFGTWLPMTFVKVNWINGRPVDIATRRVKLSSFAVGNYEFKDISNKNIGGRFKVRLQLHRFYAYYLITVYFPNTLVILLAWASFWFKPEGPRAAMCMSCLVSLTLMMNGVAGSLPKVGYVKGIDCWFLTCILLVCIAFLEYAFLAYVIRLSGDLDKPLPFRVGAAFCCRISQKLRRQQGRKTSTILPSTEDHQRKIDTESEGMTVRTFSVTIDKMFRVMYLLGFVCFCIVYFATNFRSLPEYETKGTDKEI